jgi:hypothetical protein
MILSYLAYRNFFVKKIITYINGKAMIIIIILSKIFIQICINRGGRGAPTWQDGAGGRGKFARP